MPSDQAEEKYTKPALRRRLKSRLQRSSKGGRPGEWSARKSQLLVQEYESQGGGYQGQRNRKEADSLRQWTEQNWQTKEGGGRARQGGSTKRYLPERAWDLLTEGQKRATERRKTASGKQAVANTPAAKAARAYVDRHDAHGLNEEQLKRLRKDELLGIARAEDLPNRSKMNKAQLARTLCRHFRKAK